MARKTYTGILTVANVRRIRNAWRKGMRSITIAGECLTLHQSENPAYVIAVGEYGTVAQIEKIGARNRRVNATRRDSAGFSPVSNSEREYRMRYWR